MTEYERGYIDGKAEGVYPKDEGLSNEYKRGFADAVDEDFAEAFSPEAIALRMDRVKRI